MSRFNGAVLFMITLTMDIALQCLCNPGAAALVIVVGTDNTAAAFHLFVCNRG